ncbi:hypothetical protein BD410DRAFT_842581 [Rickenella mellea]|uniref:WW domain-containing protein n=1 Tax=Rickenella mellea TaxID=50990 RepID=A0A4Y7PTG5_9AGAM|nr:hypothetical protein BD410DRAFT_842581 [Rickenella mellea]
MDSVALLLASIRRAIALSTRALLTVISLLRRLIARISSSSSSRRESRDRRDQHLLPPPSPSKSGGDVYAHEAHHWDSHALRPEFVSSSFLGSSSPAVVVTACSRVPEPITPPPLARHRARRADPERDTEPASAGIVGYNVNATYYDSPPSSASPCRTSTGALSPTGTLVGEPMSIDAAHHNGNTMTKPSYYPDDHYDPAMQVMSPTSMHMSLPFIRSEEALDEKNNNANLKSNVGGAGAGAGGEKELVPITAQNIERYDMGIRIEKGTGFSVIPACRRQFTHENPLHPSWTRHVHPDGQPYYYNTARAGPRLRYVTLADLLDASVLTEVERFVDHMQGLVHKRFGLSSFTSSGGGGGDDNGKGREEVEVEVEVFLQLSTDGTWGYYMVDHPNRCLFWLEDMDVEEWIGEIGGKVTTFAHMQHYITYEYWCHCEWFPHGKSVTREELDELMAFFTYGIIDTMTSMDSTISYSTEDLKSMLAVVKQMRDLNEKTVPVNAAAARMISFFANERLLNFHGMHGARLTSEQSVTGQENGDRSLLVTILSPLLFCAPDTHLKGLERIWVDGIIKQIHWKLFVETLKNEWVEFILYGTVLLNANVAFLSIPSVNEAAQIASLLSTASSIGGIMLGLLLVRQHRNKSKDTANIAADYLSSRTHPKLGLETLAIMYSLPYALLIMVTFLAAIAFISFHERAFFQSIVIGVTWLFIGVLIAWTIYTGWEYRPSRLRRFVLDRVKDLKRLLGVHRDDAYPENHLPSTNQPSSRNHSAIHLPTSSLSSSSAPSSLDIERRSTYSHESMEKAKGDKVDRRNRRRKFSLKPFTIIARGKEKPRMDSEMTMVGGHE